ncbi:hypothetical protein DZC30_06655 [Comamonas testosteroni]|uniref:Deaminase n=1 Tax=Comamonas testosteroni TaxID=285 RepID=A0A373FRE1_COMTE|nr:PP0621 family protein [Comamonas testosteroni]RGE45949.1 hypothetical protein DZC30_06655 [Comamonas testosteroni]
MKYLLVLLVVVIAIGIWRSKRRVSGASSAAQSATRTTALNKPQAMVECVHCGLHLPQKDAVADAQGRFFCSTEHRQATSPR